MLVGTFKVHSTWYFKIINFKYASPRGTRVEPYVHDVCFFFELIMTAMRTFEAFWQQFFCTVCPPCVGTFYSYLFKQCRHSIIVDDVLATAFTIVNRNWHAPNTLTRNYPVTTVANHVEDAVMAPFRNPLYLVIDSIKRLLTVTIYRGEPLFCGAVDNRVFTTPAVCVLVA